MTADNTTPNYEEFFIKLKALSSEYGIGIWSPDEIIVQPLGEYPLGGEVPDYGYKDSYGAWML